jgi:hypothetical protein
MPLVAQARPAIRAEFNEAHPTFLEVGVSMLILSR